MRQPNPDKEALSCYVVTTSNRNAIWQVKHDVDCPVRVRSRSSPWFRANFHVVNMNDQLSSKPSKNTMAVSVRTWDRTLILRNAVPVLNFDLASNEERNLDGNFCVKSCLMMAFERLGSATTPEQMCFLCSQLQSRQRHCTYIVSLLLVNNTTLRLG